MCVRGVYILLNELRDVWPMRVFWRMLVSVSDVQVMWPLYWPVISQLVDAHTRVPARWLVINCG